MNFYSVTQGVIINLLINMNFNVRNWPIELSVFKIITRIVPYVENYARSLIFPRLNVICQKRLKRFQKKRLKFDLLEVLLIRALEDKVGFGKPENRQKADLLLIVNVSSRNSSTFSSIFCQTSKRSLKNLSRI